MRQLLHLMIHSLYSNPEIFLRELISNGSDAADKLRYEALDRPELYESDPDLEIRVAFDKEARTITVSDNGIGMSHDEVITHIGTIAKSGTREFFASLSGDQAKDARLIGQFGVGFYSSFIVADRVTLTTRRAGLPAARGRALGIRRRGRLHDRDACARPQRGTEIVLHLREGQDELLSRWRLASIIRKYSDHIALPILMRKEVWDEDEKSYSRPTRTRPSTRPPRCGRGRSRTSRAEQYDEFYKHVAHDSEAPLAHVHAKVEGRTEYTQLLYVPAHAPFDLWDRDHRHGLKLYVRRVFIMDDAEQLLPAYLRFVRGVVDSNDLPLNVSREILQESRDVEAIRSGCVKRVLGLLEDLAENEKDKYATFWTEFGKVLKEGFVEDPANAREARQARALRHDRAADGDAQTVSLADYVGRMKDGQTAIYYVTADSHAAAANSPHLEIFRKKGIEVLLLSDRIDEWVLIGADRVRRQAAALGGQGRARPRRARRRGRKGAAGEGGRRIEAAGRAASPARWASGSRKCASRTASPSRRRASSSARASSPGNLERLLKTAGQKAPTVVPILEINPHHALVQRLPDEPDERLGDWAQLLFDQALLAEGAQLEDPAGFVRRLNALMLGLARPASAPRSATLRQAVLEHHGERSRHEAQVRDQLDVDERAQLAKRAADLARPVGLAGHRVAARMRRTASRARTTTASSRSPSSSSRLM